MVLEENSESESSRAAKIRLSAAIFRFIKTIESDQGFFDSFPPKFLKQLKPGNDRQIMTGFQFF